MFQQQLYLPQLHPGSLLFFLGASLTQQRCKTFTCAQMWRSEEVSLLGQLLACGAGEAAGKCSCLLSLEWITLRCTLHGYSEDSQWDWAPVALETILTYSSPYFPLSLFHSLNTSIPYNTSQNELPTHKLFSLSLLSKKTHPKRGRGSPCCSITEEKLGNRRQRMRKMPPSACLKCTPRYSMAWPANPSSVKLSQPYKDVLR